MMMMVAVITRTVILVTVTPIIAIISSRDVAKVTATAIISSLGYTATFCAIVSVEINTPRMVVATKSIKMHTVVVAAIVPVPVHIYIYIVIGTIIIIMVSIK